MLDSHVINGRRCEIKIPNIKVLITNSFDFRTFRLASIIHIIMQSIPCHRKLNTLILLLKMVYRWLFSNLFNWLT